MINVLLYCYFPFFEKHLGGGVQVWIRKLVEQINMSNEVRIDIICPKSDLHPLYNSDCVHAEIEDLEVNGIEPQKYSNYLNIIKSYEEKADVIWIIDREFPIKTKKPFVMSLNTICYERELKALFNNPWSNLCVVSEFEKNMIKNIFDDRDIRKIPIFIDEIFRKCDKEQSQSVIQKYFRYDSNCKYILFPHRPEMEKGIFDAIEVLNELIKYDERYRLLVPCQPDSRIADYKKEGDFIKKIKLYVCEKKLEEYVVFHDWIEYSDLPFYYSIGLVTLFPTTLPETFGTTLIHSIACSTPVISYGSGALEETVPDGLGHYVLNRDKIEVAKFIQKENFEDVKVGVDYVYRMYEMKKSVREYMDIFLDFGEIKNE